jgi:hypothetical protein
MVDETSATQFSDDVIATLESLDTFPESKAYFDEALNLRRVRVRNHKVSVVFTIDDGVYEVIAFGAFHTAGKPAEYTSVLVKRLKELE